MPKINVQTGLKFNVNDVRRGTVKYYENKDDEEMPKFSKYDVAVTAALEKMCFVIMSTAKRGLKENKTNLVRIEAQRIFETLQLNKELDTYYQSKVKWEYNQEITYIDNLPVKESDIKTYLDANFGNVHITNGAMNLLCFLMTSFYLDILHNSRVLEHHANKKTYTVKTVRSSLDLLFHKQYLYSVIVEEVNRAWYAVVDEKDEDEEDDNPNPDMLLSQSEENDPLTDDEEEDEVKTAETRKRTTKKKFVSESEDEESDEESDEETDEEDEDTNINDVEVESADEESEVEVEVEVKKSKRNRKSTRGRRKTSGK